MSRVTFSTLTKITEKKGSSIRKFPNVGLRCFCFVLAIKPCHQEDIHTCLKSRMRYSGSCFRCWPVQTFESHASWAKNFKKNNSCHCWRIYKDEESISVLSLMHPILRVICVLEWKQWQWVATYSVTGLLSLQRSLLLLLEKINPSHVYLAQSKVFMKPK